MTDKQPEALRLADFMTSKYDLYEFSEQMQVAALLRTQHADLLRKDALLRKCLKYVASSTTRDGCEADELYDAIKEQAMTPTPLPPLPTPKGKVWPPAAFDDDQMQAYATQARADLEAEVQRLREALIALTSQTNSTELAKALDTARAALENRA